MSKHTATALIGGVLAVGALGIWWNESSSAPDTAMSPPAAVASPSSEPATPRREVTRRASAKAATPVAPAVTAMEPELHDRLKPVLNRGTKMEMAAEGFRDALQFATIAHAARNTGVPFAVLKHRVLEEGQTLARAIRSSKPELDAQREVTRARRAARDDIAAIAG